MSIVDLYREYGVPVAPEKHKHFRHGWLQTHCPYCGGNRYHLGLNIQYGYFNCWRCGWKPFLVSLATLIRKNERETKEILKNHRVFWAKLALSGNQRVRDRVLTTPKNLKAPTQVFLDYLAGRNYDPEKIVNEWELKAVYPNSDLPGWAWRLYIPIHLNGEVVTYQGRSINKNNPIPYLACGEKNEIIDIKSTLYGLDKVYNDSAVVVEGVPSVWRLGPGAVATYGTNIKSVQRTLLHRFRRIFIFGDEDTKDSGYAGQKAAESLSLSLSAIPGIDVYKIRLTQPGDPADLDQKTADELMKELGFK